MNKNDNQFYDLLVNGDEASFKVIYNHFYPRLFYFVSEYIIENDHVEDIIQDTFLILWNKRQQLKPNTNLNAWLYTVAKNGSLKKLRNEKYRKEIFQSVQLTEHELELHVGALTNLNTSELSFLEINKIIQSTLNSLPPQCKLVFEMSRFESKKNKEISEELNISVKTVEGHITKAIKLFRVALKDYLPLINFLIIP